MFFPGGVLGKSHQSCRWGKPPFSTLWPTLGNQCLAPYQHNKAANWKCACASVLTIQKQELLLELTFIALQKSPRSIWKGFCRLPLLQALYSHVPLAAYYVTSSSPSFISHCSLHQAVSVCSGTLEVMKSLPVNSAVMLQPLGRQFVKCYANLCLVK